MSQCVVCGSLVGPGGDGPLPTMATISDLHSSEDQLHDQFRNLWDVKVFGVVQCRGHCSPYVCVGICSVMGGTKKRERARGLLGPRSAELGAWSVFNAACGSSFAFVIVFHLVTSVFPCDR